MISNWRTFRSIVVTMIATLHTKQLPEPSLCTRDGDLHFKVSFTDPQTVILGPRVSTNRLRRIAVNLASFAVVLGVVLCWFVAPHVSYRRRDALCALIPFYAFWFVARMGWRLAYLPYRDWLPRDDERPTWRLVMHPARPGRWAHVAAPSPDRATAA